MAATFLLTHCLRTSAQQFFPTTREPRLRSPSGGIHLCIYSTPAARAKHPSSFFPPPPAKSSKASLLTGTRTGIRNQTTHKAENSKTLSEPLISLISRANNNQSRFNKLNVAPRSLLTCISLVASNHSKRQNIDSNA
ncbi:hypothetical protein PCANC_05742 [Puccinia coronata f. sp. avenae]|uniref:Uncharacterized protein n=1 Tax=Puccinia coronata f. sp. avenae TaxID=200324 RepID=A0A2N5VSG1_9BASI|nr:hypothetical protein PCANC_05742 [Puccinia coronata f. sp. avenae]